MIARISLVLVLTGLLSSAAFAASPAATAVPGDASLAPVAAQLAARLGVPVEPAALSVWGHCELEPGPGSQLLVSCERGPDDGIVALVRGEGASASIASTLELHARVKEVYVVSLTGQRRDHLLVRTAAAAASGGTHGRQMVVEGGSTGLRAIWEREERDEIEGNADLSHPRAADLWCLVVDEGGSGSPDHVTAYNIKFQADAGQGPEAASLVEQVERPLTYDAIAGRMVEGAATLAEGAGRVARFAAAAAAAAATTAK